MVAPIRFAAPRAAPGMSECAAIVTRREDREMGKQGDRKARKQRAHDFFKQKTAYEILA